MYILILTVSSLSLFTFSYHYYFILKLKVGDKVVYVSEYNNQLAIFSKLLPHKNCEIIINDKVICVPLKDIIKL